MSKEPVPLIPIGTLVAGRFRLVRALGRGGMATVYEAHDVRLRQRVAIKVLAPVFAADASAVERFLREARAAVSLRNQHVVRVIDAGTLPEGAPYLAMEYLDGKSLEALLASDGALAVSDVVEYTLQALEALAEAHRAGIVHRDLKPENLMLVRGEDDLPKVKVIDFGISKLTGPEFTLMNLTLQSAFLGSPLYASPEQLRDASHVDARSDIWSLGVVMYELLTGRPPFAARSPALLMNSITNSLPEPLEHLRHDIPSELAQVVMCCLEKEPEDRFASAQELARALAPFAPDARSRLSVEHIVRVQSSAPPPPAPLPPPVLEEVATTPSLPPAWSTLTSAPPSVEASPPRKPSMRWLIAAAAAGVAFALIALGWQRRAAFEAASAASSDAVPLSAASPLSSHGLQPLTPAVSGSATRSMATIKSPTIPRPRTILPSQRNVRAQNAPSAAPEPARPPTLSHRPARPLDTTNPFTH
ncbi:MAG: serine/threonine-protein kinase [Myxococcota bacterium]